VGRRKKREEGENKNNLCDAGRVEDVLGSIVELGKARLAHWLFPFENGKEHTIQVCIYLPRYMFIRSLNIS
jgi:hypothetical protein